MTEPECREDGRVDVRQTDGHGLLHRPQKIEDQNEVHGDGEKGRTHESLVTLI